MKLFALSIAAGRTACLILAKAADENQSGSGLRFGPDGPTLQRVKRYRYR